jgi:hypothetical protein
VDYEYKGSPKFTTAAINDAKDLSSILDATSKTTDIIALQKKYQE